jgi:D-cysteine desulfhydrase
MGGDPIGEIAAGDSMNTPARVADVVRRISEHPRRRLAILPTPLQSGPKLPGGARLWAKRDDLIGLALGGNKVRKLEFLCGAAVATGCDTLVTVGAAQSNHARLTAAAGAALGIPVELVLGGDPPDELMGNQLLAGLFGAELHFSKTDDWDELEAEGRRLTETLSRSGRKPYFAPMGGSTEVGVMGFVLAWLELVEQCADVGIRPKAVVLATSTGGTHAGLVAGQAAFGDELAGSLDTEIVGVAVAKGESDLAERSAALARSCLRQLGIDAEVDSKRVEVDGRWEGTAYAVPSETGDAAIAWAARTPQCGWILDRFYTGKAFAGLLGMAAEGRFAAGDHVVFWHTGGVPAVFARGGMPALGTLAGKAPSR